MRSALIAAAGSAMALAGWTSARADPFSGIYINDAGMAKTADAAEAAIKTVDGLKPFDGQVTTLTTFGQQEDLAVAKLFVAQRDARVALVLDDQANRTTPSASAAKPPADSVPLTSYACKRLVELLGGGICEQPLNDARLSDGAIVMKPVPGGLERLKALRNFGDIIWTSGFNQEIYQTGALVSYGHDFKKLTSEQQEDITGDKTNTDKQYDAKQYANPTCEFILKYYRPGDNGNAIAIAIRKNPSPALSKVRSDLDSALDDCSESEADASSPLGLAIATLSNHQGDLLRAYQASRTRKDIATAKTDPDTAKYLDDLTQEIKQETLSAKKSASTQLAGLSATLQGMSRQASTINAATRFNWLTTISQTLVDVSQDCTTPPANPAPNAPATPAAPPAPANPAANATTPAAATACGSLEAAAGLYDVANGNFVSPNWLVAANAIVNAYKADAQIEADADKLRATIAQSRFEALARETGLLLQALDELQGSPGCADNRVDCALADYVTSWNAGRIPAEVFDYRDIQLQRVTNVQHWRNVMDEQRGVILAASESMKAYADGGIQPSTIAQVIFDLGLIGATAAR